MWKMYQHLQFFSWIWLTSLALLLYRICFSKFQGFLECFLSYDPSFSKILYLQPELTYLSMYELSNHS